MRKKLQVYIKYFIFQFYEKLLLSDEKKEKIVQLYDEVHYLHCFCILKDHTQVWSGTIY